MRSVDHEALSAASSTSSTRSNHWNYSTFPRPRKQQQPSLPTATAAATIFRVEERQLYKLDAFKAGDLDDLDLNVVASVSTPSNAERTIVEKEVNSHSLDEIETDEAKKAVVLDEEINVSPRIPFNAGIVFFGTIL